MHLLYESEEGWRVGNPPDVQPNSPRQTESSARTERSDRGLFGLAGPKPFRLGWLARLFYKIGIVDKQRLSGKKK